MGVASIPDHKDQRDRDEWNVLRSPVKMDDAKDATDEFVTVVSVGSQPAPAPENFVTVLSIGAGKKEEEQSSPSQTQSTPMASIKGQSNGMDGYLEEEVEVFRLPGERLGFGLKFEGGNKTTERVRRLFVQSCAEQSPASRAKCSWGALGEGDEVLSIDGVPVTHMTRLDCVRRLKESQLVIRLTVRCRGALRPEVVSAERKATTTEKSKIPPELPAAPPPVPPRKLRQTRGSADGEANPSPAKKSWDSPKSQGSSPSSQGSGQRSNKTTSYESCESSPKSVNGSNQESPKGSPKRSPELSKSKQEPPEAMVYLDARSQCGSTHGSTSDDTGSSLSTVVDRFSSSDRVSTISTASTASTTSEQQPGDFSRLDHDSDRSSDHDLQLSRAICPFDHLERDFQANNQPDYLLRRLANSEAVTHVESRGEIERITAVVAPNTVLIEETITLQPPLSFQDAPLSYGHEARPDLFYSADLAADSTTHFRPIKDDAELVERVNGDHEEVRCGSSSLSTIAPFNECSKSNETERRVRDDKSPPPLPARNHVNRIPVNQQVSQVAQVNQQVTIDTGHFDRRAVEGEPDAPILPPKPLPRKDVKVRRKRPPPPPPPPPTIVPRRDQKNATVDTRQTSCDKENETVSSDENSKTESKENENVDQNSTETKTGLSEKDLQDQLENSVEQNLTNEIIPADISEVKKVDSPEKNNQNVDKGPREKPSVKIEEPPTNKMLEIVEIRKLKALSLPKTEVKTPQNDDCKLDTTSNDDGIDEVDQKESKVDLLSHDKKKLSTNTIVTISKDSEDSDESEESDSSKDEKRATDEDGNVSKEEEKLNDEEDSDSFKEALSSKGDELPNDTSLQRDTEEDETYRSLDEINDDLNNSDVNRIMNDEDMDEDEDTTTDESDDGDYYWQSNLATIGEEEETNSLEYMNANKDMNEKETKLEDKTVQQSQAICKKENFAKIVTDDADCVKRISDYPEKEDKKLNKDVVNVRMENCGGGQRLPPDGDEFPASYQEFSNTNNQQQYRFSSTTRSMTMTTNGANVGGDDDNSTTCSESDNFPNNETFKMLATDSNSVVTSRGILLPDSRMVVSNVDICQENVIPSPDTRLGNDKSIFRTNEDLNKRSGSVVTSYSSYCTQNGNSNVLVSEKKIEIAGYYHKEVPTIEKECLVDKEIPADIPPPLPVTGPPKLETVLQSRNMPSTAVEQPTRKFSLNSELWRQDDKSERSVRDKIAMFSSQSSLDSPLFPNPMTATAAAGNGRRLSKYKSSDDVCNDDKSTSPKDKASFFADRTQSSFDLTDSVRTYNQNNARKYGQRSPSLSKFDVSPVNSTSPTSPMSPTSHTKLMPPVPQKPTTPLISSFDTKQSFLVGSSMTKTYCPSNSSIGSSQNGLFGSSTIKNYVSSIVTNDTPKSNATTLTRATSFSGATPFAQDRTAGSSDLPTGSQISRTNSLASTFRKPNEEARRNSLNQLIEQRRRSISKLRGLVIPEKDAVPIDRPIVDLPEIKSRDSILVHQMPKANIQDKWGSQSSLASNASTASVPLKATTSFKMPAPQISSKYSPAFKRKSLAVYSSSTISSSSINGSKDSSSTQSSTTTTASTTLASEPPKSLESICSPTRSDYSFEFVSTASSPDATRTRPKIMQRKTRNDYDDSDNDSAVSSSQSSISRGFSPPMSPAPSERSTVSSERSYVSTDTNYQRRSLIVDNTGVRNFVRDSIEREQFTNRTNVVGERTYLNSERSSSSSSGSNPRSPQPSESPNSRTSQIPQRQTHLRRSNSTDTNCSTSSTLTSGSQASAESLSRRVLKPQSVEAINRKNILASARCRSGRDLNGSPLIQRKFSDDEDPPTNTIQNGISEERTNTTDNGAPHKKEIKMAYIEVTDNFQDDTVPLNLNQKKIVEPKLPPKKSVPPPVARPPKSEMLEPSNNLKMWVRTEAKALIKCSEEKSNNKYEKTSSIIQEAEIHSQSTSNGKVTMSLKAENISDRTESKGRRTESESETDSSDIGKSRSRSNVISERTSDDPNDLLTILTTRSRSRSAIHVDDGTFSKSKSQMSLEDILGGKADSKLLRVQSTENKSEKTVASLQTKSVLDSRDNRYTRKLNLDDSWNEDKPFVSKIPTLGRSRVLESGDETDSNDKLKNNVTKIPTARNLNRRSASVTDMKKALEKMDTSTTTNQYQTTVTSHNRFPSLDSSVDENICGSEVDTDRCCGEQFGSISSLASSTSLISQQELAQLVEEASLEEARGAHDVIVVLLHKENPTGSVGITLAGGADCEVKEITVHRVLAHSIADKDGRVQKGDRILSINGRSTRGLTHRESLAVLKQPRSEVVLVVSRARMEEGCKLRSRTASVETIVEGFETNGSIEDTAWGPPSTVAVYKDGAGLGFSLEGGRDSPLGDRPLVIKKIFTGGAAEKTGALRPGDQLLEVNGSDVTRMSRIEAWSLMKKLHDGEVNLLVRHPATKSS